jgi:hypothetical protein
MTTKRTPENTDWEWFLQVCRTEPIHRGCGQFDCRTRDRSTIKNSQAQLRAIPQFDSGRWKLRLERVPSSTDKQFAASVVSSIAVGFTMLSPLVCLIAVYLWAQVVG